MTATKSGVTDCTLTLEVEIVTKHKRNEEVTRIRSDAFGLSELIPWYR